MFGAVDSDHPLVKVIVDEGLDEHRIDRGIRRARPTNAPQLRDERADDEVSGHDEADDVCPGSGLVRPDWPEIRRSGRELEDRTGSPGYRGRLGRREVRLH